MRLGYLRAATRCHDKRFLNPTAFWCIMAAIHGIRAAMLFALVLLTTLFLYSTCSADLQVPSSPSCLRAGLGATQPVFACTDSMEWNNGDNGKDPADCRGAIEILWNAEVTRHRDEDFEFVMPKGAIKTDYPTMHTPRRYTVGSSTLVCLGIIIGTNKRREMHPCNRDVG